MPLSNSVNFLPPYLQTRSNQRFLAATLDLLINAPQVSRFNGYVGRQFLNGELLEGNYLLEQSPLRQQYQLEAAFVTQNSTKSITSTANFIDVLNSCASLDAVTAAWNRLLSCGAYSYQGFLDIDKVINYQNYCWISNANSNIDNSWYWDYNVSLSISGTVDENILGQAAFTDLNGIALQNGMKVSFSNQSSPYSSGGWIVEGVGTAINLVSADIILAPNFVIDQNNPPDYITISRNSADLNLWSRTNLWVNKNAINSMIVTLAQQNPNFIAPTHFTVADRPILEFVSLRLYGLGLIGQDPVNYFDNFTADAFVIVQGQPNFAIDGEQLNDGDLVIFNADHNSQVRKTVYRVNFVDPTLLTQLPRQHPVQAAATSAVSLLAGLPVIDGYQTQEGDRVLLLNQGDQTGIWTVTNATTGWIFNSINTSGVLVLYGAANQLTYWVYNPSNTSWHQSSTIPVIQLSPVIAEVNSTLTVNDAVIVLSGKTYGGTTAVLSNNYWNISPQSKVAINQAPLFDIFDSAGTSYSNPIIYPGSSFVGSKLFSYAVGSGVNDPVLGFPLQYGAVGNLNDVIFDNNYATDIFSYTGSETPQLLVGGKTHLVNPQTLAESEYDCWQYCELDLELYQNVTATGTSTITFTGNLLVKDTPNNLATQVFVDSMQLSPQEFTVSQQLGNIVVDINSNVDVLPTSVILIKILSTTPIPGAWYDVPFAFDHNPEGINLSTFNMGQLRLHAATVQANANDTTGLATLQMQEYKGVPGSLLFPESQAILPSLLLCNRTLDIDQALRTAGQDYTLFKQKFLQAVTRIAGAQQLPIKELVDQALQSTAQNQLSTQAWATSDMCYWGGTSQTIKIANVNQLQFNLTQTYNWDLPSNKQLLVYVNQSQLIINQDYTTLGNTLVISSPLKLNDVLSIYEISDSTGSLIPATPTKLGLSAAYLPQIYVDYTYQTPTTVIQGHDGSITSSYGDIRDQALLEYELRVYNNLKVDNQLWSDTIETHVPSGGRWRSEQAATNASIAPYSPTELLSIPQRMFYEWAAEYQVNYLNTWYNANDLFTWNWSSSSDKLTDHQPLLGYWRGIYRWFFDSENVNTRPWEILNLSQKPSWWDTTYGPAPYTGGNQVMWQDIAAGIIRNPAGIQYSSYGARTFLGNTVLSVIPVDSSGNLLDPNDSVVGIYNESAADTDFVFGDGSPAETAWRRSSVYPFSKLRAQILQNPLFMLGNLWDLNRYKPTQDYRQFRWNKSLLPSVSQIMLNSIDNNGTAQVNSILNYTIEYLRRQAQDPSQLRSDLDSTTVQLVYPLGGYSSANDIAIYASPDNPQDVGAADLIAVQDYSLFLNQSTPTGTINYSGLIINTAANNAGYQVTGYNRTNPFFIIYPANIYGPQTTVGIDPDYYDYPRSFGSATKIVPYNTIFPDVQSLINFIAGYEQFLTTNGFSFTLNTAQNQTDWSGSAVQFIKWSVTDWGIDTPLSLVLNPSAAIVQYSATSGTLYDLTDPLSSLVLDSSGIAVQNKYLDVFRAGNNTTITNQAGGVFGCISTDIVSYEHQLVLDNVTAFNDTIYDPVGGVRQPRLQLSGQKSANWNGTLDSPGFLICSRQVNPWQPNQDYLLGSLVQWKNNNYVATQDVIGGATFQYSYFQLVSTVLTDGILPNLSLKATDLSQAYNIAYRPFIQDLVTLRNNTIGYIERDWLAALDIDAGAQTDFYRGWIKQKGSLNSLNSYGRGSTPQLNTAVVVNEEYAIKVGVYGADSRTGYGDVSLPPTINIQNPLVIAFVPSVNPTLTDTGTIQVTPNSLYEKSSNWTNDFAQSYGNLQLTQGNFPSAGPILPSAFANLAANAVPGFLSSDIPSLFFANLSAMFTSSDQLSILKIGENGGYFWFENNSQAAGPNQWDVLTFDSKSTGITQVTTLGPNTMQLTLTSNIAATKDELIIIDYSDAINNIAISGTFLVSSYDIAPFHIAGSYGYANLCVTTANAYQFGNISITYNPPASTSAIFVARSLRSNSIAEGNIATTDKQRYVVHDAYGEATYQLTAPYQTEVGYANVINGVVITSLAYDFSQQTLWSGKPAVGSLPYPAGVIEVNPLIELPNSQGQLLPSLEGPAFSIDTQDPNTTALGEVIVAANGLAAATAGNIAGNGQIYICSASYSGLPALNQILCGDSFQPNTIVIDNLAISKDANWLYAATSAATGNTMGIEVYALQQNQYSFESWWPNYALGSVSNSTIQLQNGYPVSSFSINNALQSDPYSIRVTVFNTTTHRYVTLIPNTQYTITGGTIQLTNPIPSLGTDGYEIFVTGLDRYYSHQGNINIAGWTNNTGFGSSMCCDETGAILAIGVPTENSGEVAIFNRVTENQFCNTSISTLPLQNYFPSVAQVTVNGALLPGGSYSVINTESPNTVSLTFATPLIAGSTVQITGMCFSATQTITAPNSSDNGFGTSVSIQANQLIVGSPWTSKNNINGYGAVYFYTLDTALTSQKTIPLSALPTSKTAFMLNGWAIMPASASGEDIAIAINQSSNYTGVTATVVKFYVVNQTIVTEPALQLNLNPALQTTGLVWDINLS